MLRNAKEDLPKHLRDKPGADGGGSTEAGASQEAGGSQGTEGAGASKEAGGSNAPEGAAELSAVAEEEEEEDSLLARADGEGEELSRLDRFEVDASRVKEIFFFLALVPFL